ncbi:MAG: recombinase family protein [Acidimicrobiales bacterium]
MATNIGIYARISEDPEGNRLGVTRQEDDCRALAKIRRWTVAGVYTDNDVSAFKVKVTRPEFERMLDDLESGAIDGLVVYDLDRFARQPVDLERAIRIFDEHRDLVFATVQSDIDLSTPDGRTMSRVMVAFANKSSMDTSRRLKRKHLELAQMGIPRSGIRPFGYEDDKVTIRESEAELIRQAAVDVLNGISMGSIARRWNERGALTSTGRAWRQTTLRRLLISPRMAGYCLHQGKIAVDAHGERVMARRPPILDMAAWEAVCAYLTDQARTAPYTHPGGYRYLLSGLLRCGRCGNKLYASASHKTETGRRYACKVAFDGPNCGGITVAGALLDKLVTRLVLARLSDRHVAHQIEPWPGEADLAATTNRMSELMAAFGNGDLSSEAVFPVVTKLEGEVNQLRSERAAWLRDQMALANQPTDAAESWPNLDLDGRRAIVGQVVRAVVVKPAPVKGGRFDPGRVEIVWR